jgi:sigma-E factor negative regulatory protein RseC
MLVETGRVVAVEADSLWVETVRQTTCGSCSARKGCGHGLMNQISDGHQCLVRVLPGRLSPTDCAVDDEVRISIPEEVVLRGSLVVYVLPLLCMLAAAGAGSYLAPQAADGAGALGAIAGLAVGFGLVRWHAWRHRDDCRLQPTLLEVLRRDTEPVRLT